MLVTNKKRWKVQRQVEPLERTKAEFVGSTRGGSRGSSFPFRFFLLAGSVLNTFAGKEEEYTYNLRRWTIQCGVQKCVGLPNIAINR